jgi:hypothetical protein
MTLLKRRVQSHKESAIDEHSWRIDWRGSSIRKSDWFENSAKPLDRQCRASATFRSPAVVIAKSKFGQGGGLLQSRADLVGGTRSLQTATPSTPVGRPTWLM